MAGRGLGTLTLDLIARIGGFTGPLDKAGRDLDKRAKAMEKSARSLGEGIGKSLKSAAGHFLAFAGVTASVGAAIESLKSAIDLADETRDLSIRLGVSTEAISDFRYAAQQTGTDMDTLAKGMKILAKNAADAQNPTSAQAKVFKAMGVSVLDAAGNLKSLAQLIPEVADVFKGLEDGTTKAALAQELFGKSGLDLTEFLNSGSAGLKDFGDKLRELGGEITPEAARRADDFNDKLADLKTAFGGAALKLSEQLLPYMSDFISVLQDLVKDGTRSADVANDIATGLDQIGTAAHSVGQVVTALEGLRDIMNKIAGMSPATWMPTTIGDFLKQKFPGLYAQPGGPKVAPSQFQSPDYLNVGALNGSQFNATAGQFSMLPKGGSRSNSKAIALALSNPSGSHAKGGKSDAERAAEKVKAAIEAMTKAQQDWENELAQTGNPIADEFASRLRQIAEDGKKFTEDGVPADKVKAFTDQMAVLATSLRDADIAKFQQEFTDQTAEMAAQLQGPAAVAMQQYQEDVRDLDKLLKDGAITLGQYNARLQQLGVVRDAPMADVNGAIVEQIKLLGMSNEQQEIYNNLKAAGVTADSTWGETIAANTEALQAMREQVAFTEDIKESLSGAFTDFITGAKSAKDAFGDFADHLYQTAVKFLADKAIQALFNGFGGTTTGSSGGGIDWGSIIGSFFGGGKAGGGTVTPGRFYEVGEGNKPEMFMAGGKQYMIPGNQGRVTPIGAGGSGLTVNFAVQGRMTRETQNQAAVRVARTQRLATSRN